VSDKQLMIPGLGISLDRLTPAVLPPAKSPQYLLGRMAALEQRMASAEMELSLLRIQVEQEVSE